MVIETTQEDQVTLIRISGRMDAISSPEFETMINQLASTGHTSFVLDFKGVDYISSAGLRSLLATTKQLKTIDGQIRVVNVSETVKKVFGIAGLNTFFQLHDSAATAVAQNS